MNRIPSADGKGLDRNLTLELARVTERAAVAAAQWRGRGDEMAADQAAVDAMRSELDRLAIRGRVVIGEGERDAAPMLYIGEQVGAGAGPAVDLAVAPLEGSTLCAKDMPGAISIVAMAATGSLLYAPDVYMDKIAVGPGYPKDVVDLDAPPAANIAALAQAKGVSPREITICILDRPRHAQLIAQCREAGARVRLIGDGDVAGVIVTAQPAETGVDMYLGSGGAPEGVLAAGVLRCVGGQMQGRLVLDSAAKVTRAAGMGVEDPKKKYALEELACGDVVVCATGVTSGPLLAGVRFDRGVVETETLVYRSSTGTVRRIHATHRAPPKFDID
ncbi:MULTISPECIES: class II fructose-bisphosphatase [Methylosinus]|uniref:Fructose-1,6-bisphosphatase n=1 Tax=Methylosinus trichosporium (strain ATCC 35070 / NCIMB 11131 / UNIQEM 75 / OB3b) TaxID=595536 RepID=A0A2D2D4Z7_METT3|nr:MULTISPECIES: class II fructose-bisphosphatase [Methylosinus]ATQ70046.1 fructose-bisphosphatase class II [Methylosinus trichosporium OB3b]OBS53045.1 fructose-1,6-bisphosphatase, class II [Methylosinus sp. 3S-1]